MTASTTPSFVQMVQDYFCGHLINQRDASPRTVASYRDTFRLLLGYLGADRHKQPSQIALSDLTPAAVAAFLTHLERERHNSVRTRNHRFAAIRAFLRYASARDPSSLLTVQQVLAIPMKRFDRPQMGFLSRSEVDALLATPDVSKWCGRRDRVMFTVLYNTGARVSELVSAKVQDLVLEHCASLRLHGKGRKDRTVPLWKDTARSLRRTPSTFAATEGFGLNRCGRRQGCGLHTVRISCMSKRGNRVRFHPFPRLHRDDDCNAGYGISSMLPFSCERPP